MSYDFTYLSLGLGIQSSTVFELAARGLKGVPKPDVAIFSDTQSEPAWVYDALDYFKKRGEEVGIPVHVVTAGNLGEDALNPSNGRSTLPAFTAGDDGKAAMLLRKCTKEYKIAPIEKGVRTLLGYVPRQRVRERVRCMIGISTDEVVRAKPSRTRWVTNVHPLLDAGMSRADCISWLEAHDVPVFGKSSCIFCPFHDDQFWSKFKAKHPDEFARAVEFDEAIRDSTASGVDSPVYLHRALQPLDTIDFEQRLKDRYSGGGGQHTLWADGFVQECEGMCGV